MGDTLAIFDLDGTLVDSETLANRAFLELLPDLDDTADGLVRRYRGLYMGSILADLETRLGRTLPEDFEPTYRARVAALFESDLKPMPGVHAMLERLDLAKCIASSGPHRKINVSMRVCGLTPHFGEHVFSSYDIRRWKPDPGLFLHAAAAMGYTPENCVVIEDSAVGVEAATAAGMRVFQYLPDAHEPAANGAMAFRDMSALAGLVEAG